MGTTTALSNPFSDSHEVSSLADVDVGNLDQVEMSVYESATGGQFMISVDVSVTSLIMSPEAAVVFDLHGRNACTQQVVATFSPEVIVGDEIHAASELLSLEKSFWG
jgi:hypothetical protein